MVMFHRYVSLPEGNPCKVEFARIICQSQVKVAPKSFGCLFDGFVNIMATPFVWWLQRQWYGNFHRSGPHSWMVYVIYSGKCQSKKQSSNYNWFIVETSIQNGWFRGTPMTQETTQKNRPKSPRGSQFPHLLGWSRGQLQDELNRGAVRLGYDFFWVLVPSHTVGMDPYIRCCHL